MNETPALCVRWWRRRLSRFSECGIFRHGFARIRCQGCREEYLLAFSCKTRYFCPSCQVKQVSAFVERVTCKILYRRLGANYH